MPDENKSPLFYLTRIRHGCSCACYSRTISNNESQKTMIKRRQIHRERRGAMLVLVAFLTIPLLAMLALAVDYGYLLKEHGDLQRYADCAALAAVQELTPDTMGYQDLGAVRAAARGYVSKNLGNSFTVLDSDISVGRYDPATVYSNLTLLNDGVFDTVRVKLRRDSSANSPVSLFFAKVFGTNNADVTASGTAALQKGRYLLPGADVLPVGVPKDEWNSIDVGDTWVIYGDGKMEDLSGNPIPGNWGTVDIGDENNSTSDMGDQIVNGLRQTDLDALHADGRIDTDQYIDAQQTTWLQADPGLSSGMKHYVQQIHGQTRIIPLYEELQVAGGNNLEFKITQWGVVKVVDSNFQGSKNSYIKVQKAYIYESKLRPHGSLSVYQDVVSGAYTSPTLIE